jgi:Superinfection immunity protein
MDVVQGMFGLVVGGVLYFLPSLIAQSRRRVSPGPTVVVNVFLGWTVIGWIVALAMAFGGQTKPVVWQ